MSLTSIALALALSTPATPDAPAPAVTFKVLTPIVGDSCKTTTHTSMSFHSDDPAIIAAFGTERGGDKIVEETVLEVKRGLATKVRLRVLQSTQYGLDGERSVRTTTSDSIEGDTFLLTRLDDKGHFAALREDGSLLSAPEEKLLQGELDKSEPGLLTGRAMKLKNEIVFNRRETKKYFPFEDELGASVRGFEMTLGAIDGKTMRIDGQLLLDLQGVNGEASVGGTLTIHTDVDQRNIVTAFEGPVRVALATPANGIGQGADEKVDAPHVLQGTFETTSQMVCVPRP